VFVGSNAGVAVAVAGAGASGTGVATGAVVMGAAEFEGNHDVHQ